MAISPQRRVTAEKQIVLWKGTQSCHPRCLAQLVYNPCYWQDLQMKCQRDVGDNRVQVIFALLKQKEDNVPSNVDIDQA